MSKWLTVGLCEEFKTGVPVHVEIDGTQIVVVKLADKYYAIEDVCTHDGGQLSGGCVDHDVIICPRHGARFSLKTGEALSAPAYEPTTVFTTRVAAGKVQITDDRFD